MQIDERSFQCLWNTTLLLRCTTLFGNKGRFLEEDWNPLIANWQRSRTQNSWVKSTNATSVLCRPTGINGSKLIFPGFLCHATAPTRTRLASSWATPKGSARRSSRSRSASPGRPEFSRFVQQQLLQGAPTWSGKYQFGWPPHPYLLGLGCFEIEKKVSFSDAADS